jgi:exosortase E/protease (VPEID-CTERM system)
MGLAHTTAGARPHSLPLLRWGALGVLLLLEIIVLSVRFDAQTVAEGSEWWAKALKHGLLAHVAITFVLTTLVFGAAPLRREYRHVPEQFTHVPGFWMFLVGHLVTVVVFYQLTARVLEGDIRSSASPGLWVIVWAATGLASGVLWALSLLRWSLWQRLAKVGAGALLAGMCVGVIAGGAYKFNLAWRPLSETTLWSVDWTLRQLGMETVCQPADGVIGTPSFQVRIDRECSGYEGIGLIWIFLSVYLWVFRQRLRFPQALLLLPLGTALSWTGNILRIVSLICFGTWVSPELAESSFHSLAGWLLFNGLALGLVLVTQRSPFFAVAEHHHATARTSNSTAPYLLPLLAILATAMVTGLFTKGFDGWYPLRVVVAGACLWYYRQTYRQWSWAWSWPAAAVGTVVFLMWIGLETLLGADTANSSVVASLAALAGPLRLGWLVFRVVGTVITVPLAEEIAFRGYLTRRLQASRFEEVPLGRFTWFSFLASSVLFGALHGRWLAGTLAGMLFALVLYRRGRVGDAVLAHSTANALLAGYVLATGSWELWS